MFSWVPVDTTDTKASIKVVTQVRTSVNTFNKMDYYVLVKWSSM